VNVVDHCYDVAERLFVATALRAKRLWKRSSWRSSRPPCSALRCLLAQHFLTAEMSFHYLSFKVIFLFAVMSISDRAWYFGEEKLTIAGLDFM
jgi:hypothetical protein